MLETSDIYNLYNDLYAQLRKYIWDFDTVKLIADLETACYQRFPSLQSISNCCNKLYCKIRNEMSCDEEFQSVWNDLIETVNSSENTYAKLSSVKEVIL